MKCTFFGHRDCYGLDRNKLFDALEQLIQKGVDTFYVGQQGYFDGLVLNCLTQLKETYPSLSYTIVLAYLPTQTTDFDSYQDFSLYPDGLETVHPKFAIERRNKWMLDRSDYCLCYINHTHGGAYKFARMAKRKGLTIINLGSAEV